MKQLIAYPRAWPLSVKCLICTVLAIVCLGTSLLQGVCRAEYIDVDPWSVIVDDLEKPDHVAAFEMLSVDISQAETMEREDMPEWLIQLADDAFQAHCLPPLREWILKVPDLEEAIQESPSYRGAVEHYSVQTLMKADHQFSTYLPDGTPFGNFYAAYDGSECTGMMWDLLHAQKRPWATFRDPYRVSGAILDAVMLNVDKLKITRSITLLIDGAGHIGVLIRIDDIQELDGIGELGPVLASNNRPIVGADGAVIGVVHETGVSLVHPDILIR